MATVNIPVDVRRSLALVALAELVRAGRLPSAGELARHTGWGRWTAKKVVAGLRRDGLWPDQSDPSPVRERAGLAEPAPDPDPPPKIVKKRPDIEAECKEIREGWSEATELSRRASGRRVPARVANAKGAEFP